MRWGRPISDSKKCRRIARSVNPGEGCRKGLGHDSRLSRREKLLMGLRELVLETLTVGGSALGFKCDH